MGSTDYKFEGWMGLDKEASKGNMVWQEFEPKPWEETDIDMRVTHCGICGSDMHTLRSGWVSHRDVWWVICYCNHDD
jgi:D-arabinose 1-dehydrogenase-like Zn-dependent alcohol dehydrogenase